MRSNYFSTEGEVGDGIHLSLLGPVQVERAGAPVHGFESRKALALLCYLAAHNQPLSRSHLADLFWEDKPEAQGRANLSRVLHNLSSLLPACLQADRHTVQFTATPADWVDLNSFAQWVEKSRGENFSPAKLAAAVALYRGDFMAEFYLDDCPEFETWLVTERERWRQRVSDLLQKLIDHHTQRHEYEQGREFAARLLELDPWREEAHQQMMRLLAYSGQRSAALFQYEICRRVLAEELGVEPGAETAALYEQIRTGILDRRVAPTGGLAQKQRERGEKFPSLSLPIPAVFPLSPRPVVPFVAREQELAQLDGFLDLALSGRGRVAFVIGEAGLGKTALVQEFARRAQERYPELVVADGNCNAYGGIGDPYLPFREILGLLAGDIETKFSAGDIASERARRLYELLPHTIQALLSSGPDLLDIFVSGSALVTRAATVAPTAEWVAPLEALVNGKGDNSRSPTLTQSALFAQYTEVLHHLARQRPLLLILDDLHWADSASISLLFHLGRRLEGWRILVLGTYRPSDLAMGSSLSPSGANEEKDRHPLEPLVNELQRRFGPVHIDLAQAEGREFIEAFVDTEPNRLTPAFREALYRQTEGHALFTVEMLRGLQARGDLQRDEQGFWGEGPSLDWKTLPARVEGVIGERIARLPAPLREALKTASVEGEFFTAEVVAQVQGLDERQIVRQLSNDLGKKHRLVKAQDSQRLASRQLSHYRFQHILFQRYLYHSLDEAERVYMHEAVGLALERLYHPRTELAAVQLARHFQAAGVAAKAAGYLQIAGEQAVRNYANHEAVTFFNEALAVLKSLPDTPEYTRQELALQLALISPLIATKGWAAPEVKQAALRAQELCLPLGETHELFRALRGLWNFFLVRGQLRQARKLGQQLHTLAQRLVDPALYLEAHYILGSNLWSLGEFTLARQHFEQSIALYQPQQHRAQVLFFGPDLNVFCHSWLAHTFWHLGYPDRALQLSQTALAQAQELAHPFSQALALDYAAMLHQFRQDRAATLALAERAIAVCSEHGFAYYLAWATMLRGWATAAGSPEEKISQIRQGLADLQATGGALRLPYYLALLAEVYAQAGQIQTSLTTLDEALAVAAKNEDCWYEAELYRLKGELLQAEAKAEVEQCFWQAIEIARRQEAKSLELRAVMSLSRLRQRQGKKEEAHQMLAEIYSWFTEGFDTADLREAKALLKELAL